MDEEMEEEEESVVEFTFTVVEIDLDCEFEAARYFDFTREESTAEAREAELWFESAVSYPPSPFVLKLVSSEELLLGNVNVSPKSKGLENTSFMECGPNIGLGSSVSAMDVSNGGVTDCDVMNGRISIDPKSNIQKLQNQPLNIPTGVLIFFAEAVSRLTFGGHRKNDNSKFKTKSSMKPSFARTSTLMKPTASQLAKQNQQHQVENSRFQKLKKEKSTNNFSATETQAPKRQKLEEGHLRKVGDTFQHTNLVHKVPKRAISSSFEFRSKKVVRVEPQRVCFETRIMGTEGTTEGNLANGRLRLTIPREPDLVTAQRARRIRAKTTKEREHVPSAAPAFKALPLNRKILEAPSFSLAKRSTAHLPEFQEFHLKTSERAMQHTSAVSSSSFHCSTPMVMQKPRMASVVEGSNGEYRRTHITDAPKLEGHGNIHQFKALPLNRKIFSSKGDLGVFRNSKRETTVPMELNFQTEKRFQHDPPVDLFNKLSLTSELQPNTASQLKLHWPTSILEKGLKENRFVSFQQESEVKLLAKPSRIGVSQVQHGNDNQKAEVGSLSRMGRSLGIR